MDIESYQHYDGLGLAELIRQKSISPKECLQTAIDAVEKMNPSLNAVNVKDFDRALEQSDKVDLQQPFAGVPFLLKDMVITYEGLPTSCGSRYLSRYVWDHDSELVKRYKQAGLVIIGKTNVPEFGLSPSSENNTFGDTCNPWDKTRSAGGSSAGSAAAVASGMVPMAHASDGGGSIRIPASCCGLFGFKPTRGSMPTGPDYGRLWQGLAIDHALTRSVRDSAALLDISAGADLGAPLYAPSPEKNYLDIIQSAPKPLRIAYSVKPFFTANCAPACIDAVESTARLCEELGHHVEQQDLLVPEEEILNSALIMMSSELAAGIEKFSKFNGSKPGRNELEITTRVFYQFGRQHQATAFLKSTQTFELLTRKIAQFFTDYDVLITPTLSRLPIKLGELAPTMAERMALHCLSYLPIHALLKKAITMDARRIFAYIPFTLLFNITGQPAMSIPLGQAEGLPVGVQFAGGFGQDAMLLQLARQIEIAKPWFNKRPEVSGTTVNSLP